MKTNDCIILSTSPQTHPARKLRRTASLALRQRRFYGRQRRNITGKELDPETGLYYYGARYLDPKTGRWLSGDPALGEYVPSAPVNDVTLNRYWRESFRPNGAVWEYAGVINRNSQGRYVVGRVRTDREEL